ncbi:MAG: zinc ABC transporter ATP-binding protein ZnuC [Methyloligellaceae bacterium]
MDNSARTQSAAQTQETLIDARDIGVFKSGKWLVKEVSMSVRRGEILTLIGPNGAGKSTLVRTLLGLLPTDQGTIFRKPQLRIGYVPQALSVDEVLPLTVKRLLTLTGPFAIQDIETALAEVGIGHLLHAQLKRLSGGEFQRALLARAIIRKPDLLVLDEPLRGVDFSGQIELYGHIRSIRDRLGCGILLVSHDLHLVMAETDKVICLNGHVCCSGTPEAVSGNPEYLQLFGPRATEALAIYHHDHDHAHGPDGCIVPLTPDAPPAPTDADASAEATNGV